MQSLLAGLDLVRNAITAHAGTAARRQHQCRDSNQPRARVLTHASINTGLDDKIMRRPVNISLHHSKSASLRTSDDLQLA